MEAYTRKDCEVAVDKLNQFYAKNIQIKRGHGVNTPSPCADFNLMSILLPADNVFYSPHIIAHEYAHFLNKPPTTCQPYLAWHNESFDTTYRECCLVLGIFAVPTNELVDKTIEKWNNKHPDRYVKFIYPKD